MTNNTSVLYISLSEVARLRFGLALFTMILSTGLNRYLESTEDTIVLMKKWAMQYLVKILQQLRCESLKLYLIFKDIESTDFTTENYITSS